MTTAGWTDERALDAIATLLGTSPDWSADTLEDIADVVGQMRPHPGDGNFGDSTYADKFLRRLERPVPPLYDRTPETEEASP